MAYRNPLGVRQGPCSYCDFCEWFGCDNYSKASPQTTLLPVLVRKPNFVARDQCEVTHINPDPGGSQATGVTFVDTSGQEWEQPADLVLLCAYTIFNVQLLMLSRVGQPYNPVANRHVSEGSARLLRTTDGIAVRQPGDGGRRRHLSRHLLRLPQDRRQRRSLSHSRSRGFRGGRFPAVATYVRNSWGHAAGLVSPSAARAARESGPGADAQAR